MVVVVCPCCNSNNVDFDKDDYSLNTGSSVYFKCNNCEAEFEKAQADYEKF